MITGSLAALHNLSDPKDLAENIEAGLNNFAGLAKWLPVGVVALSCGRVLVRRPSMVVPHLVIGRNLQRPIIRSETTPDFGSVQ